MASYLVQEEDGASRFTLEDGTGSILLDDGTVPVTINTDPPFQIFVPRQVFDDTLPAILAAIAAIIKKRNRITVE